MHIPIQFEGKTLMVHAYRIIGTKSYVINVWKLTDGSEQKGSSITTFDGIWYDKVGTDPDPTLYDHLKPYTKERSDACHEAYRQRFELSRRVIKKVFDVPETTATLKDALKTPGISYWDDGEWSGYGEILPVRPEYAALVRHDR